MNAGRRTVLVAVLEYGELPELLRVANVIRVAADAGIVFFFTKPSYRRLAEDTRAVLAEGHLWMGADGIVCDKPALLKGLETTAGAVADTKPASRSQLKALAVDLINCAADFRQFRSRGKALDHALSQAKPALVVIGQDPVGSDLSFMVKAARRKGIAVLLAPFAMFNVFELAEYARARPSHLAGAGVVNRLVARLFPRWRLTFRGRDVLRLPGSRALALELSGLAPDRPWVPCSSAVSALACDCEQTRQSMVGMGVDSDQISVVGAAVHDRLAMFRAQGRSALTKRFGLRPERQLVVCGWPANIFPWLGSRTIGYPDYPSVARAWAAALAHLRGKFQWDVLITVHPKTLDEELEEPRSRGLATVRGDSDELVAHCDLFTTLNGSSITAWAIACGKPVLLFDCFETNYPEFTTAPGCTMVRTEAEFREELERLAGDPAALRVLAEKQASVAAEWGVLDGNASRGLGELARRLVSDSERRMSGLAKSPAPAAAVG